jgi:fatty acid desaturase
VTAPQHTGPIRRVTVTSPQTAAARPGRTSSASITELEEQTPMGEVLIASLMRAQLATALRVLAAFVGGLAGLPALFALWPALGRAELASIPIPWLLLGVASFPLLVVLGWVYLRQAERNEADFEELVTGRADRSEP